MKNEFDAHVLWRIACHLPISNDEFKQVAEIIVLLLGEYLHSIHKRMCLEFLTEKKRIE